MNNYRAAVGFYLLLVKSQGQTFLQLEQRKQEVFSVLLHCCIIDLTRFLIKADYFSSDHIFWPHPRRPPVMNINELSCKTCCGLNHNILIKY